MTQEDDNKEVEQVEHIVFPQASTGLNWGATGPWLPRSKQSCANCNAYFPRNALQGDCRANPPTPILLGLSEPMVKLGRQEGMMNPIMNGFPAPVAKTYWCRQWQFSQEETA
jgi:hypothetical protein